MVAETAEQKDGHMVVVLVVMWAGMLAAWWVALTAVVME